MRIEHKETIYFDSEEMNDFNEFINMIGDVSNDASSFELIELTNKLLAYLEEFANYIELSYEEVY